MRRRPLELGARHAAANPLACLVAGLVGQPDRERRHARCRCASTSTGLASSPTAAWVSVRASTPRRYARTPREWLTTLCRLCAGAAPDLARLPPWTPYLAIASKRDVKTYADRPLADDSISRILDAGRLSGSAKNRQPWQFVVVEDGAAASGSRRPSMHPRRAHGSPCRRGRHDRRRRVRLRARGPEHDARRLERADRVVTERTRRPGRRARGDRPGGRRGDRDRVVVRLPGPTTRTWRAPGRGVEQPRQPKPLEEVVRRV